MAKYNKAFFGVAEDEPFDLKAAVSTYEWVMEHPDEAPFVVSKMLFDTTSPYMEYHKDTIDAAVDGYISKRIGEARRGLSRSISKSAKGAIAVLDEISKAVGDYTEWERRENVRRQMRDASGRFRTMNRSITSSNSDKPLSNASARKAGVPATSRLSRKQKAAYQSDYTQVREALQQADADTLIVGFFEDGTSTGVMDQKTAANDAADISNSNNGLVRESDYAKGKRLVNIQGYSQSPIPRSDALAFDALTAMGGRDFAQYVGGSAQRGMAEGGRFAQDWNQPGNAPRDNSQMWRRIEASSRLANVVGAPVLPDQAKLALKAGEWAGRYAPQAEQVIGPTSRRAAYRYRGVEKTPAEIIQFDINNLRSKYPSGRQAREALINGEVVETPIDMRNPDRGTFKERKESRTIAYLKRQLPDPTLYNLNLKSGTTTPSQGIIIDKSGKVVTEAVGYGEDWYLPFNLKNLSRLKGGEYIRTRAYGGPTTEDIYVGLVSGARAVTTVSHSGVTTVVFDDTFRGSRRYNDKAGRMHARYGQLLDAVKSRDVTLGEIPMDRMEELRSQAASNYDPDTQNEDYKKELERLKVRERSNPDLSEERKNNLKIEVLDEFVQDNDLGTNWGNYIYEMEAKAKADGTWEDKRSKFGSVDDSIKTLGLEGKANKRISDEKAKYAESMNPLSLNGKGYAKALMALKDQFPYYIADVQFHPSAGGTNLDFGYVKPKFIRPSAAKEGYYDETITGQGKVSADYTNYQNWSVMQNRQEGGKYTPAEERVERAAAPKATSGEAATDAEKQYDLDMKSDAILDVVKAIREQNVWGATAGEGPASEQLRGQELTEADRADLMRQGFGIIYEGDIQSVRAKLATDKVFAGQLQKKIADMRALRLFDIDEGLWRNYDAGGQIKAVPLPNNARDYLNNMGNKFYEFPGLMEGRSAGEYQSQIDKLVSDPAIAELGITPETPSSEVRKKVSAKSEELLGIQRIWDAYDAGKPAGSAKKAMNKAEIKAMAEKLARVDQAYAMRDMARRAEAPETPTPQVEVETPEEAAVVAAQENFDPAPDLEIKAQPYVENIKGMVGMNEVGEQVDALVSRAITEERRKLAGLPPRDDRAMHLVFMGRPGTGKTSVANQIAPLYHQIGLIDKPEVKQYKATDLISQYAGATPEKTLSALNAGKGGVIIIDEAYSLADARFGQEAVDTLVPWLSENKGNTVVILAGYGDKMGDLMDMNAGMTSRFPTQINFRDYNAGELNQIANSMFAAKGDTLDNSSKNIIRTAVKQIADNPNTGNGRDIENMVNNIRSAQEVRMRSYYNPTPEMLSEVTEEDVRNGLRNSGIELPKVKVSR